MERVGRRIRIEDQHGPRRVGGRLERIEVAEIESLVAEGRAEVESSKMVRHFLSPWSEGWLVRRLLWHVSGPACPWTVVVAVKRPPVRAGIG